MLRLGKTVEVVLGIRHAVFILLLQSVGLGTGCSCDVKLLVGEGLTLCKDFLDGLEQETFYQVHLDKQVQNLSNKSPRNYGY